VGTGAGLPEAGEAVKDPQFKERMLKDRRLAGRQAVA
jgi:hypothetical protein